MKKSIKVKMIPSDYELKEYYHYTTRSIIEAIRQSGDGITRTFILTYWKSL